MCPVFQERLILSQVEKRKIYLHINGVCFMQGDVCLHSAFLFHIFGVLGFLLTAVQTSLKEP